MCFLENWNPNFVVSFFLDPRDATLSKRSALRSGAAGRESTSGSRCAPCVCVRARCSTGSTEQNGKTWLKFGGSAGNLTFPA